VNPSCVLCSSKTTLKAGTGLLAHGLPAVLHSIDQLLKLLNDGRLFLLRPNRLPPKLAQAKNSDEDHHDRCKYQSRQGDIAQELSRAESQDHLGDGTNCESDARALAEFSTNVLRLGGGDTSI
jgi:hypothetical protein